MRLNPQALALQQTARGHEQELAITWRRVQFWRRYRPQTQRAARAQGNMLAALDLLRECEPEAQAALDFDWRLEARTRRGQAATGRRAAAA